MKTSNLKIFKMKALKSLVVLIAAVALLSFRPANVDHKITVVVNGFKNADGNCIINLYNKSEGFPNSSKLAYKSTAVKIKNNSAQIVFDNIESGTYAVSVLHDANADGVMNKNFLGIPKEGYGASNNIISSLSSPRFEDSKFEINTQDKTITINVKY
jgi:uncharacterized protein (DUF2141 family)